MTRMVDIDRGWKRILKSAMDKHNNVSVGIRGSGSGKNDLKMIALYHEKGGKRGRPPKRSFIAPTIDKNKGKYLLALDRVADRIISHGISKTQGLMALGKIVEGNIKATIIRGIAPPLAESTKRIKRKHGLAKLTPLIFHGRLINSITHWLQ